MEDYVRMVSEAYYSKKDNLVKQALDRYLIICTLPWACFRRRCQFVVALDKKEYFCCDGIPLIEFLPAEWERDDFNLMFSGKYRFLV